MPSAVLETPIGPLGLVASDTALQGVLFSGDRIRPEGSSPVLAEAAFQLDAYFEGELVAFDLPVELDGSEFQRSCWLALASIPYGQTVSYGEQARRLRVGPPGGRTAAGGHRPKPPPPH